MQKISVKNIEAEANNGALLNKFEIGLKTGVYFGIDFAAKINTGITPVGVAPERTRYAMSESTRIPNFIFKLPSFIKK